ARVDVFEADMANRLKPVDNKCEAGKLKAVCKQVCCGLGADRKVVIIGGLADFSRCDAKFPLTFAKLERATASTVNGGVFAIQPITGGFVSPVFSVVAPTVAPTTTYTSTTHTTTTTTSTLPCVSPKSLCSGQCVDPATDAQNCGSCGNSCPSGTPVCSGG